jgi:hypothetical protein
MPVSTSDFPIMIIDFKIEAHWPSPSPSYAVQIPTSYIFPSLSQFWEREGNHRFMSEYMLYGEDEGLMR